MDEVLWRHTENSGVTVSSLPVSVANFRRSGALAVAGKPDAILGSPTD